MVAKKSGRRLDQNSSSERRGWLGLEITTGDMRIDRGILDVELMKFTDIFRL